MKTILVIEIETKEDIPVLFEEGDVEKEYTKDKKIELIDFRKDFAREIHRRIVNVLYDDLNLNFKTKNNKFLYNILEDLEEYYVEGWNNLKDYKTNIKVIKVKP